MRTLSNTSPLLYLHRIGQLGLLPQLYETVTIPPAVRLELQEGRQRGVDVPEPADFSWLLEIPVRQPALLPLVTDLGRGKSEVIALALEHPGSRVILDDQLGRKIARLNGITVTGTVGVLLKAKQRGLLPRIAPLLQALRESGLWLGESS